MLAQVGEPLRRLGVVGAGPPRARLELPGQPLFTQLSWLWFHTVVRASCMSRSRSALVTVCGGELGVADVLLVLGEPRLGVRVDGHEVVGDRVEGRGAVVEGPDHRAQVDEELDRQVGEVTGDRVVPPRSLPGWYATATPTRPGETSLGAVREDRARESRRPARPPARDGRRPAGRVQLGGERRGRAGRGGPHPRARPGPHVDGGRRRHPRQRGRLLARRPAGPRAARRHRGAALPHRRPRGRAGHRLRRGAHQGAAPLRRQRRPDRLPPPAPHPRRGRHAGPRPFDVPDAGGYRVVTEFVAVDEGGNGDHVVLGRPLALPPGDPGDTAAEDRAVSVSVSEAPTTGPNGELRLVVRDAARPAGRARHLPRGVRPRHRLPPRDRRDGAPAPARPRPRSPRPAPS